MIINELLGLVIEDKFANVYEIGKTALEKFGEWKVEDLKKYLQDLDKKVEDNIIQFVEKSSTNLINGNWGGIILSTFYTHYLNFYNAVSQISFENPGLLRDFKEADLYIKYENVHYGDSYIETPIIDRFNKYIKYYNRFSKEFDLDYLKSEKRIDFDDSYRFDDYICKNIASLYKNESLKSYLQKYFIWNGVLKEEDFVEILELLEIKPKKSEKDTISYYFSNFKEIMDSIVVKTLDPETLKKINQTIIYQEFGTF